MSKKNQSTALEYSWVHLSISHKTLWKFLLCLHFVEEKRFLAGNSRSIIMVARSRKSLKEWLLERLGEKWLSATSKIYPGRKKLVPLDAIPAAEVAQKGVKENQLFCMTRYCLEGMAGSWRAEDRLRGQQHSAPLLPYVLTPNNLI